MADTNQVVQNEAVPAQNSSEAPNATPQSANEAIKLLAPQGYVTGFPVRILIPYEKSNLAKKPKVFVKSENLGRYEIALKIAPAGYEGELLFSVPGTYEVLYEGHARTLQVKKGEILDFGTEFGIFSSVVVVLLIWMVVWVRRRSARKPVLKSTIDMEERIGGG